jgi:hypothetical protein
VIQTDQSAKLSLPKISLKVLVATSKAKALPKAFLFSFKTILLHSRTSMVLEKPRTFPRTKCLQFRGGNFSTSKAHYRQSVPRFYLYLIVTRWHGITTIWPTTTHHKIPRLAVSTRCPLMVKTKINFSYRRWGEAGHSAPAW